jgi:hypothetical protein
MNRKKLNNCNPKNSFELFEKSRLTQEKLIPLNLISNK